MHILGSPEPEKLHDNRLNVNFLADPLPKENYIIVPDFGGFVKDFRRVYLLFGMFVHLILCSSQA